MPFVADQKLDFRLWNYITGDYFKGMSIVVDRWYYLVMLLYRHELKVACRDPDTNSWSRWERFPGSFMLNNGNLSAAVDVHRSVFPYEIVIESDYPTYEANYKAAKVIGLILEERGFIPHYYYSGNKSIHIHVFFDWDCLPEINDTLKIRIRKEYRNEDEFKEIFIEWLRTKMIDCWDTKNKEFDRDLIRASHLIRCELSKNKLGFKTFLGYSYKDVSFVPYICNEDNRIYPRLGKMKKSCSDNPEQLFIEFFAEKDMIEKKQLILKKNRGYRDRSPEQKKELRGCIKVILSDEFKNAGDGMQRGMFIIVNELKQIFGPEIAKTIVYEWNERMGHPIRKQDIDYRLTTKEYILSCDYIHSFLKELNINIDKKCNGKV